MSQKTINARKGIKTYKLAAGVQLTPSKSQKTINARKGIKTVSYLVQP